MSQMLEDPIRILIVDDHPVVRAGLTSMPVTQPQLEVIGAASSGEEAMEMPRTIGADVLLLDLRMLGLSGIDVLHALKASALATRAIILTSFETDEDIYRSVHAGAQSYLLKDTALKEMIEVIRTVHAGKRYIPRQIAARLAERMMRTDLTARELQILEGSHEQTDWPCAGHQRAYGTQSRE